MKGIMNRFSFSESYSNKVSKVSKEDIFCFHQMLLKMKKKRPNLNVNRIMLRLYPNFKLPE